LRAWPYRENDKSRELYCISREFDGPMQATKIEWHRLTGHECHFEIHPVGPHQSSTPPTLSFQWSSLTSVPFSSTFLLRQKSNVSILPFPRWQCPANKPFGRRFPLTNPSSLLPLVIYYPSSWDTQLRQLTLTSSPYSKIQASGRAAVTSFLSSSKFRFCAQV
jgi:hypothetical protein